MSEHVPDDDELMAELRAAYTEAEPIEGDVEFARAAFAWRTVDDDLALAELAADSLLEPALVRRAGLPGARVLSFDAPGGSLHVELVPGLLVGRLDPAEAAEITLTTSLGAVHRMSAAAGTFQLEDPPSGTARFTCESRSVRVRTPWVRL
jgi:hypothetical protein